MKHNCGDLTTKNGTKSCVHYTGFVLVQKFAPSQNFFST